MLLQSRNHKQLHESNNKQLNKKLQPNWSTKLSKQSWPTKFQFSYMEFLMRPREGSTTMHKERLWIGMREFGKCTWLRVDDLEEEIKGERCKAMRLHILIVSLESLSLTLTQFFYVVSGFFFQWYISSKIYRSMYCNELILLQDTLNF